MLGKPGCVGLWFSCVVGQDGALQTWHFTWTSLVFGWVCFEGFGFFFFEQVTTVAVLFQYKLGECQLISFKHLLYSRCLFKEFFAFLSPLAI